MGHVVIHTTSDTATGDPGVYLPPTGQARLGGNVHIIHGPNELAGSDALVNMKTGVATLLAAPGGQVSGVILPNSRRRVLVRGRARARTVNMMNAGGLIATGLGKRFKKRPVVRNVSLSVKRGEAVGLLGPEWRG